MIQMQLLHTSQTPTMCIEIVLYFGLLAKDTQIGRVMCRTLGCVSLPLSWNRLAGGAKPRGFFLSEKENPTCSLGEN